jgi:hypothetical protein
MRSSQQDRRAIRLELEFALADFVIEVWLAGPLPLYYIAQQL